MTKDKLREIATNQLDYTFKAINQADLDSDIISGKVRDSITNGIRRTLIATDRLSAFDKHITTIPFKGQILNQMALYWFKKTNKIAKNHIIDSPHPYIINCHEVNIVPVEVIVRGYLAGSAWRDYQKGNKISGVELPKYLMKSSKFETPILTPSTKASQGDHDEPISEEEILERGIVNSSIWSQVKETALELFKFGQVESEKRGLILVDTKYEFGTIKNKNGENILILADEVHTQDSSRYWIKDSYLGAYEQGTNPLMLDKEFVRTKLIELGFMGDGEVPKLSDNFRVETALKYIKSYETITGEEFIPIAGDISSQILPIIKVSKES